MPSRRAVLLTAAGLAGVFVLFVATLWLLQRGQILPNTSIAGIDVGGLTPDEAATALAPAVEERLTQPVAFSFEDEQFTFEPSSFDYAVDLDASIDAAMRRGRTNVLRDVPARVAAFVIQRNVDFVDSWDATAVHAAVDTLADHVDRDRSLGSVRVDPETLEVHTEMPLGRASVRRAETAAALEQALVASGPHELVLPVDMEPQPLPDAAVEDVAAQVAAAIAGPLELLSDDDVTMTIAPADLAALVEVVAIEDEDPRLELQVTEDGVDEVIGEAARATFDVSPRNARYTVARVPPRSFDDQGSTAWSPVEASVGVEPGRDGRRFNPATAAEELTELLRQGARDGKVTIDVVDPAFGNAQAEELRPTHLLGTFTTYYTAGQVRNHNIQKLADVIDGALVQPGEQFSINEISGERSCAKGYRPAGTIIRGELVDTCGGGTSQFGTTTFNAAFFAGVKLDQWQAHSWYISRYPMGREATLTYPQLDVKFTNNTGGAIVVKTTHTATSVTVSLYGRPIATRVLAQHGDPFNPKAARTQTRDNPSLPRGTQRVVQSGLDGFTVDVVRIVELNGGGEDRQNIRTVYPGQPRIVERGTGPPPPPPDDDDEDG